MKKFIAVAMLALTGASSWAQHHNITFTLGIHEKFVQKYYQSYIDGRSLYDIFDLYPDIKEGDTVAISIPKEEWGLLIHEGITTLGPLENQPKLEIGPKGVQRCGSFQPDTIWVGEEQKIYNFTAVKKGQVVMQVYWDSEFGDEPFTINVKNNGPQKSKDGMTFPPGDSTHVTNLHSCRYTLIFSVEDYLKVKKSKVSSQKNDPEKIEPGENEFQEKSLKKGGSETDEV
jgi:hypothetical protein